MNNGFTKNTNFKYLFVLIGIMFLSNINLKAEENIIWKNDDLISTYPIVLKGKQSFLDSKYFRENGHAYYKFYEVSTNSGEIIREFEGEHQPYFFISKDKEILLAGTYQSTLNILDQITLMPNKVIQLPKIYERKTQDSTKSSVIIKQITNDNRFLTIRLAKSNTVLEKHLIYDLLEEKVVFEISDEDDINYELYLNPTGNKMILTNNFIDDTKYIRIYDFPSLELYYKFTPTISEVFRNFMFTDDGRTMIMLHSYVEREKDEDDGSERLNIINTNKIYFFYFDFKKLYKYRQLKTYSIIDAFIFDNDFIVLRHGGDRNTHFYSLSNDTTFQINNFEKVWISSFEKIEEDKYLVNSDAKKYLINFQPEFYLSNRESTQNELKLYPNPTNSTIFLELFNDNLSELEISIFNELGNLEIELTTHLTHNQKIIEVDIKNLTPGAYILKTNISPKSLKFIKE